MESIFKERLRHNKDDIIETFRKVSTEIEPHKNIQKLDETQIPVLNKDAKPSLELMS